MKLFSLHLKKQQWLMIFLMALIFIYLVVRNTGLNPIVFADELIYSTFARSTPLRDVTIPSYLYFLLFSLSNSCGDHFLDCTRLVNTLFFIAGIPFLYLIAKQVTSVRVAATVAILCALAPFNSYTVYFMPESMFFFSFTLLSWVALTKTQLPPVQYGFITGSILGLMSLIKIHALFLLPAFCLFVIFFHWSNRKETWIKSSLVVICCTFSTMFAIKFSLGYVFAGSAGLQIFGGLYGTQAEGSLGTNVFATFVKWLPALLFSLKGHLMAIVLLFALPLASIIYLACSTLARAETPSNKLAVHVYALLMLAAAFLLAVTYTASIADFSPVDSVRLHMRYYNFTFPLLIIVAASGIETKISSLSTHSSMIALLLAAALIYSTIRLQPDYTLNFVDGPEIAALAKNVLEFRTIVGVEVALIILWAFNKSLASRLFIFLLLPLCMVNSDINIRSFLKASGNTNSFDSAGIFARHYLSDSDRKELSIAGTDLGQLMRAKFHADQASIATIDLAPQAALELSQAPRHKKWLLVVGDHALPSELKPKIVTKDYALIQMQSSHQRIGSVKFSTNGSNDILASVTGLSIAENWGRWSMAKQVTLYFTSALPKNCNLLLKAQAYGPNVGQAFIIKIGEVEKSFRVSHSSEDVFIQLQTDGTVKTMTIEIPQPVSPQELGSGTDRRQLGLGLTELEIGSYVEN